MTKISCVSSLARVFVSSPERRPTKKSAGVTFESCGLEQRQEQARRPAAKWPFLRLDPGTHDRFHASRGQHGLPLVDPESARWPSNSRQRDSKAKTCPPFALVLTAPTMATLSTVTGDPTAMPFLMAESLPTASDTDSSSPPTTPPSRTGASPRIRCPPVRRTDLVESSSGRSRWSRPRDPRGRASYASPVRCP